MPELTFSTDELVLIKDALEVLQPDDETAQIELDILLDRVSAYLSVVMHHD